MSSALKAPELFIQQPNTPPVKAPSLVAKAVSHILTATDKSLQAPTSLDTFVQGLQISADQKELVKRRLATYRISGINEQPQAPQGVEPIDLQTALSNADPEMSLETRYARAAAALGLPELSPAQQQAVQSAHALHSDTEVLLLTQSQLADKLRLLTQDDLFTAQQAKTLIYQIICGSWKKTTLIVSILLLLGAGGMRYFSHMSAPETPATQQPEKQIEMMDVGQLFSDLADNQGDNMVQVDELRNTVPWTINMKGKFELQWLADKLGLSTASLQFSDPFLARIGYTGEEMNQRDVEGKYALASSDDITLTIGNIGHKIDRRVDMLHGEQQVQTDLRDALTEEQKKIITDSARVYTQQYVGGFLLPAFAFQEPQAVGMAYKIADAIAQYHLAAIRMTNPDRKIVARLAVEFVFPEEMAPTLQEENFALSIDDFEGSFDYNSLEGSSGDVRTVELEVVREPGAAAPTIHIIGNTVDPIFKN